MAITSIGYPNPNVINDRDWAKVAKYLGTPYDVDGVNDCKVTALPAALTISVAPGTIHGKGVTDIIDAAVSLPVTAGTGTAGTKRYDLVYARRNWDTQPTGTTTLVVVPGGASTTLPATRNKTPGTLDDQPLAMIQVTTGSTVPVVYKDLRTYASKLLAVDDLNAVAEPKVGGEAIVRGVRYRYVVTNGIGSWQPVDANMLRMASPVAFTLGQDVYTQMTWPSSSVSQGSGLATFFTISNGQITIQSAGTFLMTGNVSGDVRTGSPTLIARIATPGGAVHCEQDSSRLRVSMSAVRWFDVGATLALQLYCAPVPGQSASISIPVDGSLANAWTVTRLSD